MPRVVAAETLDHLATDDPAARRSRRDLVRVHRCMGTRSIVMRAWRELAMAARGGQPLRILEIGAGDGSLLLGVAKVMAPNWPPVQLTLLDRQDIVSPATLAGYAALGWTAQVHVADVLAWADGPAGGDAGKAWPRWHLANAVTREDAVLSVHAGFSAQEITAVWPRASGTWRTREFAAGPFIHCFIAPRARVE